MTLRLSSACSNQLSYAPPKLACRAEARSALKGASDSVPASASLRAKAGGADEDRTRDLLLAKQALSQLSYGPAERIFAPGLHVCKEQRLFEN
jgi:hypothetical protein